MLGILAFIWRGPRRDRKIVMYKNGDHSMLLTWRNFLLSMVNVFIQIFVHIHVWIHVIHACARNFFLFSSEKCTCSDCFKFCRSSACFDHKKSRKFRGDDVPSKCDTSFRCQTCSATVERKRGEEHRCGHATTNHATSLKRLPNSTYRFIKLATNAPFKFS